MANLKISELPIVTSPISTNLIPIVHNNKTSRIRFDDFKAAILVGTGANTNLSLGIVTGTTININSSTGTPVTIPEATITEAGLLNSTDKNVLNNTSGTNSGDQTITLTGDVTGSGTGSFAATVAANAITLSKMATVATGTIFYRKTAGTGIPEVQTLATLKTDLGLTGTNSGDQTITLTGDVTGSGTGSFAATIAANAITNNKLAQMSTQTFKGRNTAGTGNPEDLTVAQVQTMLNISNLTNYKVIKVKADFPTPSAGVITLVANTYYLINGSINLGTDRLVTSGDCKIEGLSAFSDNLIYTGTATALFNSTDHNVSITNLSLISTGATSKVFEVSNVGKTKNFVFQNSVITSSISGGNITGYANVLLNVINMFSNTTGFTFIGNGNLFLSNVNCNSSSLGTQVTLPSGTYNRVSIRNCVFDVAATNTGLNIQAGSITVTNNISIIANAFSGLGTLTTGFTVNNSNYVVESNSRLSDFVPSGSMAMIGNVTQTLNVSGSTWRKILGTTTGGTLNRFTMPTNNRLTYVGLESITVRVSFACAAYYTSGASRIAEIGLYKNGVLITNSQNGFTIKLRDEPCSTSIIVTLNQNDYIEGWFQKFGGAATDDYVFSYLNIQINEL